MLAIFKMKFGIFFFCVLAVLNVNAQNPATPAPPNSEEHPLTKCPDSKEIDGCICYPATLRITCDKNLKQFKLSNYYKINTLSIDNVPNLNIIVDKTIVRGKLKVDSLIIRHVSPDPAKLPSLDILQEVFSISTTNVKITSSKTAQGSLDIEDIAIGLNSLIIEGVRKLVSFDTEKLSNLNHLKIIDSNLENNLDVFFQKSKIKFLEFQQTNIAGFSFNPESCDDNQIILKVRDNKDLKTFEFLSLVNDNTPNKDKCNYHIDLSNNPKLDKNILNANKELETVKKFYNGDDKKMYLVMKQDILTCSCDFYKNVYLKKPQYIHGLTCETNKLVNNPNHKAGDSKPEKIPTTKLIDELELADFDNCAK